MDINTKDRISGGPLCILVQDDPWRKALRVLIGLKLLLVPLVFDVQTLSSFDIPKAVVSHVLAWIMAAVLAIILLREPWQPRFKRIHLLVLGFVISGIFSTWFADDRYIALFGYPYRLLGLTTILDLGLLYAAIVIAVRTSRDLRLIIWGLVMGAIISSFYALLQLFKLDPLVWGTELGARIFSTFGNPDFYGQYLSVLVISLIAVSVFHPFRWRYRAMLIIFLAGILYLVGAVGTRSALIGIGAGVIIITALWMRRTQVKRKTIIKLSLLFFGGGMIVAAILSQTYVSERLTSYLINRGFQQRGIIYETALRAFADRPIFGIGPDNIGVLYFHYRPVRELNIRGPFYVDSSAHGWPVQILTTQGIVGFLIFLAILLVAAQMAWRLAPTPYGPLASIVAAALTAHFGAGLLTPGSISTEWIGWAGLGLLAAIDGFTRDKERLPAQPLLPPATLKWLLAPLFLVTIFVVFLTVRPYVAARYAAITVTRLLHQPNAEGKLLALDAAIKATWLDSGRADLWKIRGTAEEFAGNLLAALASYEEATRRAPYYPEHWWNLARINVRLVGAGDPTRKEAVLAAARQALQVDPNGPESYAAAAKLSLLLGENQWALDTARRGIELFRNKPDYYILAATAAHRLKESKEAERILKEGILVFSERAPQLTDMLHSALAQLYLELGDMKKSEAEVSIILERNPGNAEAQAFMDKLKNLKK